MSISINSINFKDFWYCPRCNKYNHIDISKCDCGFEKQYYDHYFKELFEYRSEYSYLLNNKNYFKLIVLVIKTYIKKFIECLGLCFVGREYGKSILYFVIAIVLFFWASRLSTSDYWKAERYSFVLTISALAYTFFFILSIWSFVLSFFLSLFLFHILVFPVLLAISLIVFIFYWLNIITNIIALVILTIFLGWLSVAVTQILHEDQDLLTQGSYNGKLDAILSSISVLLIGISIYLWS